MNLLAVLSTRQAAVAALKIFCTPFYRSRKPLAPVFGKAEKLTLRFNEHTVRGHRWNKGGAKRVLILHGFESSSNNFDRYITPMVNRNFEVLAFDAPAHGRSSGRQITLPEYVETIAEIYRQYGPIDSFMAHSFGGLALALFLETIPHNEHTRAVLIAPATETRSAFDSFFRFLQLSGKVRKEFEKLVREKSGVDPNSHFSINRAISQIQASILWIHDQEDEVTPFADVIPVQEKHLSNITWMVTKGLGHKKIYRENKVVKAVVGFV